MTKNGGKWPSRDDLARAIRNSVVPTLTGTVKTREDNDGVVDQIVGVTAKSPNQSFPVIGQMVRYKGDAFMPPRNEDAIKWISSLNADFVRGLPKPGSYQ